METHDTLPHPSDGSILYDSDQSIIDPNHQKAVYPSDAPIFYDNNHLNKIEWKQFARTYVPNQAIVYLDSNKAGHLSMDEKIEAVKQRFCEKGVPYDKIITRQCANCDINIPMFLVDGPGVDTVIVSQGVPGGTSPQPQTVGESYSLNFLSQIPKHKWDISTHNNGTALPITPKEETVTIAVLDTGLDEKLVDPAYVCDEFATKEYMPCFNNVKKGGWNFLNNSPDFTDDNGGRHGSLVSQYIINQFKDSPKGIKIMPLKTHDANGGGDLFSIMCAIHFAIAKGANIINASWGFYYYYEDKFLPYFKNLIGNELQQKGILFVTAAGNKIDSDDKLANRIWQNQGHARLKDVQLRDLGIHKFFPAHLSAEVNNIVTVTTMDAEIKNVSSQQNHSDIYVDLGIKADINRPDKVVDPSFKVPFELIPGASPAYVAGSSFATAIATGHIGANNDMAKYKPGLKKGDFINPSPISAGPLTPLIERPNVQNLVRNGTCVQDYIRS